MPGYTVVKVPGGHVPFAYRLLDETGLAMEMNRELVGPVARILAREKSQVLQK